MTHIAFFSLEIRFLGPAVGVVVAVGPGEGAVARTGERLVLPELKGCFEARLTALNTPGPFFSFGNFLLYRRRGLGRPGTN